MNTMHLTSSLPASPNVNTLRAPWTGDLSDRVVLRNGSIRMLRLAQVIDVIPVNSEAEFRLLDPHANNTFRVASDIEGVPDEYICSVAERSDSR